VVEGVPFNAPAPMIRRLGADDLELYKAIRTEALTTDPDAFGETLEAFMGRPDHDLRAWFRGQVESGDREILVEERAGAPRGMCGCGLYDLDPGEGYLWGMFVSPWSRRQGIGHALVHSAADFLTSLGVRIMRGRVAAPNRGALDFYRGAGFTIEPATEQLRPGSAIPVHPMWVDLRRL
jgi:ribosomal protein S18 acetylase RimI-like enzyme